MSASSRVTRICPICGGASEPAFMAASYRMYRCAECRSAFVWPQPSAEELDRFYHIFHLTDESGGYYDEVEGRMRADFPAKVEALRGASGGDPGRVLDVGCGKGYFVRACVDR